MAYPWGGFSFMTYLIYGNLTYSNTSNRNTAQTAINNVLAGYSVTNVAVGALPAGVQTSGTTALTIAIRCSDSDVNALRAALLPAWTTAARATTGHYISAVKE